MECNIVFSFTRPPMTRSILTAGVAAIALVGAVSAADKNATWPQFRGPSAGVAADDPSLPESWSAATNVVWKSEVPGIGWSSPVVWGDHVFVSSVVNTGQQEAPKPGLYFGGERPAPASPHR